MPSRLEHDATANLELRDYLSVLLRRRWLIALITAAILGAMMTYTYLETPVYEAQAGVLLDEGTSQAILSADQSSAPSLNERVVTEMDLMRSAPVRERVLADLGYLPAVSVKTTTNNSDGETSRIILVSATDPSPRKAVQSATDFANSYVKERKVLIAKDLSTSILNLSRRLKGLDEEVAAARKRIDELSFLIASAKGDDRLVLEAERDRLRQSLDGGSLSSRVETIQSRIDRLTDASASNNTVGIFKISPASVPTVPSSPLPRRRATIGLALGLLTAIIAAFIRDYFDDTMRTKDDLDNATGGIPVLSIVPAVSGWRNRGRAVLESVDNPYSATSEAYRTMRTSIEFAAIEHKISIIHVTSSTSGEGKTTTAANLAVALAGAGKRVVLVDCDLRRPRLHKFFDMENTIGFTSVLVGEVDTLEALQEVDGVTGLTVLPSGPRPPNPSELLGTKAAHNLLKKLAELTDTVIIDSPPLLPVADSSILAGYADASVLVVTARSTTRRLLGRSLEVLAQANAPLEGIVFNSVSDEATYGYSYSYGYIEGDPQPDSFWARALRRGREG